MLFDLYITGGMNGCTHRDCWSSTRPTSRFKNPSSKRTPLLLRRQLERPMLQTKPELQVVVILQRTVAVLGGKTVREVRNEAERRYVYRRFLLVARWLTRRFRMMAVRSLRWSSMYPRFSRYCLSTTGKPLRRIVMYAWFALRLYVAFLTWASQLVPLPRQPCVNEILEEFKKYILEEPKTQWATVFDRLDTIRVSYSDFYLSQPTWSTNPTANYYSRPPNILRSCFGSKLALSLRAAPVRWDEKTIYYRTASYRWPGKRNELHLRRRTSPENAWYGCLIPSWPYLIAVTL